MLSLLSPALLIDDVPLDAQQREHERGGATSNLMLAYLSQEGPTALGSAEQLVVDDVLDRQKRNVVTGADQGYSGRLHVFAQRVKLTGECANARFGTIPTIRRDDRSNYYSRGSMRHTGWPADVGRPGIEIPLDSQG